MSSQERLNSIAIEVVGKYNETAKHLVATYRAGTSRAVSNTSACCAQLLDRPYLRPAGDDVKRALLGAEQHLAEFVTDTVIRVSDRAEYVIDAISQRVIETFQRVEETTAGTPDSPILEAAGWLNLPAARASLGIASGLAQVSKCLSERAAGFGAVEVAPVAEPAAKPVRGSGRRVATRH